METTHNDQMLMYCLAGAVALLHLPDLQLFPVVRGRVRLLRGLYRVHLRPVHHRHHLPDQEGRRPVFVWLVVLIWLTVVKPSSHCPGVYPDA